MTLLINKQLATATATANDFVVNFLSSAGRSLEVATATAQGNDAIMLLPPITTQFLVISGGGSGGYSSLNYGSGGGGAGGYISSVIGELSGTNTSPVSTVDVSRGVAFNVTVGGANSDSIVPFPTISGTTTIQPTRGGLGTGGQAAGPYNGGSGGGEGRYRSDYPVNNYGLGINGEGNRGGGNNNHSSGGGGGGAGAIGGSPSSYNSGSVGGDGIQSSITGTATYRAAGGNGIYDQGNTRAGNTNGGGGGTSGKQGLAGNAYTGSGGGGSVDKRGRGAGGSGIVILLYPDDVSLTLSNGATSLNGTNLDRGDGYRYTEIITSGTVEF